MTSLSVVVANVSSQPAEVAGALDALARELEPDDQMLWVDAGGVVPGGGAEYLRATGPAGRGQLYAQGLDSVRNPVVAFTDSVTQVEPGWRRAVAGAVDEGAVVVGGPVLPASLRSAVTSTGFFIEYGPHAVAPFTSKSGDVSANNVAYLRSALSQVLAPGEAVWKSEVNDRLRARGEHPLVVPAMRVTSQKIYGWNSIGPGRFSHGRLYGSQRARAWSPARRAAGIVGCAALPALAYARLARRIAGEPALRVAFATSTPLVLMALCAWSAGEAWGYLRRDGNGHDVF